MPLTAGPKRPIDGFPDPAVKRKAHAWKIGGGALLLLSFVTQNYFYDRWNQADSDIRMAVLEGAVADKSVLLNEILYLDAGALSDSGLAVADLKRLAASEAARKLAYSTIMPVAYNSDLSTQVKTVLINQLTTRAGNVRDLRGFFELVNVVNSDYGRFAGELAIHQQALAHQRDRARWLYLAAYVTGSLMLLYGLRYD
ncbi:MAG: hypothetical protein M3065_00640 [Actinomycetota bacterium]|nr:hypothetical protein [Actinomycetota bacterium]